MCSFGIVENVAITPSLQFVDVVTLSLATAIGLSLAVLVSRMLSKRASDYKLNCKI
ncbi:hypothetical protein [Methanotorris formicicus]|uniref:Uncharacterized protein n=1 Tax=Methanotorris formicicus Mc-S-70 TaxID=647171 RepID=H1L050_9EURY|nr:hypothetical protein [Methanotorris formicicus]EHP85184.1 hypothetical protein MetfoDRAFT_1424 [Methanotorris formicicus Mc-S-70]